MANPVKRAVKTVKKALGNTRGIAGTASVSEINEAARRKVPVSQVMKERREQKNRDTKRRKQRGSHTGGGSSY